MTVDVMHTYEIREEEMSLRRLWEKFSRMNERDSLMIRGRCGNVVVDREDISKVLTDALLPEKYDLYLNMKAALRIYQSEGMHFQVEDTLREMKQFRERYLGIPGGKKEESIRGSYYKK
ncbi:MAG: hypothetical protein V1645_00310 [archaeon]